VNIDASASLSGGPSQKEKSRKSKKRDLKEKSDQNFASSICFVSFLFTGVRNAFNFLFSIFYSFLRERPPSCVERDKNDSI